MPAVWKLSLGANPEPAGTRFRVWAPTAQKVDVVFYSDGEREARPLHREQNGYHTSVIKGVGAGARYKYSVDGAEYPDPASRSQPDGVHEPSEVVDPSAFEWTDANWPGLGDRDLVIYELHIGTFTPEGTFDAAISRLDALVSLGVSAVEVMPIASYSGTRNWGYDGVMLYAPTANYGGPDAFKRFVDAAHARKLGVILDVVYNHFGPEGNYLPPITGGKFFTDRHRTPWGDAINYDGPDSGPVRDFVLQNALHWAHEYHVDGLRLDATHAIVDDSPTHLLREISDSLHALQPPRILIAEDERNERRVVLPPDEGGYGLDAVWADDLHHQLRRLAAGDDEGYFRSYSGTAQDIARTLCKGWFYEGQFAEHHGGPRGTPADGLPTSAFVHCIQNHDQVGNRAMGDRLGHNVSPPVYRALSALLLLSPYTPLIWMGQEWNASSPFQFFTDFPEELGHQVTNGRREEFKHFSVFADEQKRAQIPDPQAESTFTNSKLRWEERESRDYAGTLALYQELLRLRRDEAALRERGREQFNITHIDDQSLAIRRCARSGEAMLVVVSARKGTRYKLGACETTRAPNGSRWSVELVTEEPRFGGDGRWGRVDTTTGDLELAGPGAVVLTARARANT
jgi:maltooligosyltrehalose trehalohydrolase